MRPVNELHRTVEQEEHALFCAGVRQGRSEGFWDGWQAGRAALIREQLEAQQSRAEALELRRVVGGTLADMEAARSRANRQGVAA